MIKTKLPVIDVFGVAARERERRGAARLRKTDTIRRRKPVRRSVSRALADLWRAPVQKQAKRKRRKPKADDGPERASLRVRDQIRQADEEREEIIARHQTRELRRQQLQKFQIDRELLELPAAERDTVLARWTAAGILPGDSADRLTEDELRNVNASLLSFSQRATLADLDARDRLHVRIGSRASVEKRRRSRDSYVPGTAPGDSAREPSSAQLEKVEFEHRLLKDSLGLSREQPADCWERLRQRQQAQRGIL